MIFLGLMTIIQFVAVRFTPSFFPSLPPSLLHSLISLLAIGWIFRKSSSNQQPVKRFGLIRNEFLFFFHNPSNDKPIGLIPLKGTQVYTPPNGDNSFETTRQGYNATQGTHSLTHSHTRSLASSLTHSLTHSLIQDLSLKYHTVNVIHCDCMR